MNNKPNGAENQIEPFRIPLIPGMSDGHNRCLAVLATFENPAQPSWCYDLGYTYLSEVLGKDRRAAMRRVLALKNAGYVTVEDMGKVKGAQLSNRIRVNWVQVIAETEPVLAKRRAKYEARGVVSKLPPGSGKSDTLVPNYLPEEKKLVPLYSAPAKASAAGVSQTLPERTKGKTNIPSSLMAKALKRGKSEIKRSFQSDYIDGVFDAWLNGCNLLKLDGFYPLAPMEIEKGKRKGQMELPDHAILRCRGILRLFITRVLTTDMEANPVEVMRFLMQRDCWGKLYDYDMANPPTQLPFAGTVYKRAMSGTDQYMEKCK